MPVFYAYNQTILSSQSTVDGSAFIYQVLPPAGATWRYTGSDFMHVVREEDTAATLYNGDPDNETFQPTMTVGQSQAQTTVIDGVETSVMYDFTFGVTDGTTTYEVSVIDADLNNDGTSNVNTAEQGYYLVFRGTPPPPDTDLTVTGLIDNADNPAHTSLGGTPICFAADTLIDTAAGPRRIDALRVGDRVATVDHGLQPVRWIGTRRLGPTELAAHAHFRPIRIAANALGRGYPARDLLVSPQHRVMLTSKVAGRMFGAAQVLVAAKHLAGLPGIAVAGDVPAVTYIHLLFDAHQVIYANGLPAESLFTGPEALKSVDPAARREIFALLPDLAQRMQGGLAELAARPLVNGRRARQLLTRHARNARPLRAVA